MRLQATTSTSRVGSRLACVALCALGTVAVPRIYGQAAPPPSAPPAKDQQAGDFVDREPKRFLFGFRARGTPLKQFSIMSNRTMQVTTNPPLVENNFVTTSRSFPVGFGGLVEGRINRHLVWRIEAMHQGLKYDKVNNIFTGTARTASDSTERTTASTWEFPAMVQFRPRARSGLFKNIYFAGGANLRTIRNISTVVTTNNADGSTSSDRTPAAMVKKNLPGTVVAIGWRFIDDFRINFAPEFRYTRWSNYTFNKDSTQSPRNQLEAGFSFTF